MSEAPTRARRRKSPAEAPPFEIAGLSVPAGTRRSGELRIADLSTHTPLALPLRVVNGTEEGPTLLVCAAIHGDEINGVEIIRRVLKHRTLRTRKFKGTLVAVPVVNVLGFISQSRYLPDRRDLNRSFPGREEGSLASRLARTFLNDIVARCTHGVDLHTGAIHRPNYPQIRADLDDPEAAKMAEAFGVPTIINASLREGSLREAAQSHGVPIIVYEGGEAMRFDEGAIRAGVGGVVGVMRMLGMIPMPKRLPKAPKTYVARSSVWVRAPQSGIFRSAVALGAWIKQGDVLGFVNDLMGERERIITAPADGVVIGRTNAPTVYEGEGLFHIARFEGTKAMARALDAYEPLDAYDPVMEAELPNEPPIGG